MCRPRWSKPEGLLRVLIPAVACARLVFLVHALWYVSFVFGRLVMLGITAGMDQKEGRSVQKTAENPQLQFINKVVFLLFVVRG